MTVLEPPSLRRELHAFQQVVGRGEVPWPKGFGFRAPKTAEGWVGREERVGSKMTWVVL